MPREPVDDLAIHYAEAWRLSRIDDRRASSGGAGPIRGAVPRAVGRRDDGAPGAAGRIAVRPGARGGGRGPRRSGPGAARPPRHRTSRMPDRARTPSGGAGGRDVRPRAGGRPRGRTAGSSGARRAGDASNPTRETTSWRAICWVEPSRPSGRSATCRVRHGRPTGCLRSRPRPTTCRRSTTSARRTRYSSRQGIAGGRRSPRRISPTCSARSAVRSSAIGIERRSNSSRARAICVRERRCCARSGTTATTAGSTSTPSRSCGRRARSRSPRGTATPRPTRC